MSKSFLLLVLCAAVAAFGGTWLMIGDPAAAPASPAMTLAKGPTPEILSCEDAQKKGLAPMYAGTPGYRADLDPDGDGLACPPA